MLWLSLQVRQIEEGHMKTITVIPTQDSHYLASCLSSGAVASGKTHNAALENVCSLIGQTVLA